MGRMYIATRSFPAVVDGKRTIIHRGTTRVDEGHPLLKEHPDRFKPMEAHFRVETARQAPGETRTAKTSTKKTARKTTGSGGD